MFEPGMVQTLVEGVRDTLYMVLASTAFGYLLGLPLGILLCITGENGIRRNPVIYRILDIVVNLIRSVPFLILLILGYFPMIKPRLPKKLARRPLIKGDSLDPRFSPPDAKGLYEKKLLYSLLPYAAERGEIKFVPPGTAGAAKIQIKAARDGGVWMTNPQAFAGKQNITFNGMPIPEKPKKRVRFNVNNMIAYKQDKITYTCYTAKK